MGRNLSLRHRRLLSRGLNPYNSRRWGVSVPFLSLGVGNRASKTLGTGNSAFQVFSRQPGTLGNSTTFRVVVAGASTPASVAVTGSFAAGTAAVTFNSATSAGSAATSTVADMIRLVNSDVAARPLVHVQRAPGSDGTGVVAAVAATALTGAV
jgi:hypothetical protein